MKDVASEDRRLIALAAVFVPSRAPALFGRLVSGGAALVEAAARAAAAGRRERLAALGIALEDCTPRDLPAELENALALERHSTAAAARSVLRRDRPDAGTPTTPFQRLLHERVPPALDRLAVEGPRVAPRNPPSPASSQGGPLARSVK